MNWIPSYSEKLLQIMKFKDLANRVKHNHKRKHKNDLIPNTCFITKLCDTAYDPKRLPN